MQHTQQLDALALDAIDHDERCTAYDQLAGALLAPCAANFRVLGQLAADRGMAYVCVQPALSSWARKTEDLTTDKILTMKAIENALIVDLAIGGSTNSTLHLPAIARACGLELPLERFNDFNRKVPTICGISPSPVNTR